MTRNDKRPHELPEDLSPLPVKVSCEHTRMIVLATLCCAYIHMHLRTVHEVSVCVCVTVLLRTNARPSIWRHVCWCVHTQVFRLKVNTSTAEQGWNALHRTYTTQLMTHDHAYLHLHTLSRAASQYLAGALDLGATKLAPCMPCSMGS